MKNQTPSSAPHPSTGWAEGERERLTGNPGPQKGALNIAVSAELQQMVYYLVERRKVLISTGICAKTFLATNTKPYYG